MKEEGLTGLMIRLFPDRFKKGEWWLKWPWFWYRQLWHVAGGLISGGVAVLSSMISLWMQVILAAMFAAVIVGKETKESFHQPWYKTVVDLLAWMVPFILLVALL